MRQGRDRSDNGAHCFSCGYSILSDDRREQLEESKRQEEFEFNMSYEFTEEDHKKLKENTSTDGNGLRSIDDETYKWFGVRHEHDTETGEIKYQYYPVTTNYKFTGYKRRELPKKFECLTLEGTNGVDNQNELFGQFRFKNNTGKYVIIVGGEIDQLSAFQMLKDYQDSKGYEAIPVVSPTTGETGSAKQLQRQYSWFDKFERIILCFDNDAAGEDATEKAVKVLPRDKVFVMPMTLKDPNEYLETGREKDFISCFFKSHKYVPTGIVGSDQLLDRVLEHAAKPKLPLPPFMLRVSDMMAGGIPLRNIINLGAASGIGKTTIANELIYFWIWNSPYKLGVVSMELDSGQYGEVMLSRHIGRKIALIPTVEEKLEFLGTEDIQEKATELFKKVNGDPRWHLVDDRDGTIESIKKTVEQLVIECDCQVIVLDPLQDLLDGLSNEEQADFMRWQKQLVKQYDVILININHARKSDNKSKAGSMGAFITEEDFHGSSSIFKSAAANILIMRNKYDDDEIERNTTHCMMSKCRWTGNTGHAGEWYYDNKTHRMWDKHEFFKESIQGF
jgi:archaellum biogenesis ATPase FlaH